MGNAPADAEVSAILDGIRRLVRLLRVSARAAEAGLGLTSAQLFVLQKLAEAPATSIAELSGRTLADPSSVSTVVARLVQRKLVRRAASRTDARRAELALTPAGRKLLRAAPEPAQVRLVEALHALAPTTRRGLAQGLGTLVRDLGIAEGVAPLFFEEDGARRG